MKILTLAPVRAESCWIVRPLVPMILPAWLWSISMRRSVAIFSQFSSCEVLGVAAKYGIMSEITLTIVLGSALIVKILSGPGQAGIVMDAGCSFLMLVMLFPFRPMIDPAVLLGIKRRASA